MLVSFLLSSTFCNPAAWLDSWHHYHHPGSLVIKNNEMWLQLWLAVELWEETQIEAVLPGSLGSSGHPVQEGGCEEQEPSCYTGETQCSCAPAIAFLPSLPPTSLVLEIMMTEPLAPSLSAAATVFHCACVLERAGLWRGPGRGKCLKWKCLKICLFLVHTGFS